MSLHNKIVADEQGRITIGDFYNEDKNYSQSYGTQDHVKVLGVNLKQTLGQTAQTYASAFNVSTTLTNELDNNSDLRPRATIFNSGMDMAGQSYTRPGLKRGPMATAHGVSVQNTSDSAVTLQTMSAQLVETMINQSAGQDGDITVIDAIGIKSATHIDNQGSGNSKFHNHFSFYSENNHEQVDKGYGFYVADQKAKEEVDKLNSADQMIFQTEKQLKEFGDKLSDDKKKPIESSLEDLKKAHESKDLDKIDEALNTINEAWKNASEEMYKAQGDGATQPGADNPAQESAKDSKDDVQDVDFEEVKED